MLTSVIANIKNDLKLEEVKDAEDIQNIEKCMCQPIAQNIKHKTKLLIRAHFKELEDKENMNFPTEENSNRKTPGGAHLQLRSQDFEPTLENEGDAPDTFGKNKGDDFGEETKTREKEDDNVI